MSHKHSSYKDQSSSFLEVEDTPLYIYLGCVHSLAVKYIIIDTVWSYNFNFIIFFFQFLFVIFIVYCHFFQILFTIIYVLFLLVSAKDWEKSGMIFSWLKSLENCDKVNLFLHFEVNLCNRSQNFVTRM